MQRKSGKIKIKPTLTAEPLTTNAWLYWDTNTYNSFNLNHKQHYCFPNARMSVQEYWDSPFVSGGWNTSILWLGAFQTLCGLKTIFNKNNNPGKTILVIAGNHITTLQTFTSASRRVWNPHNGYMGFIQEKGWGCLQGALANRKAQQQAAGQRKSLDPLTVHCLVPHRESTLVQVTVRVWNSKNIDEDSWDWILEFILTLK